MLKHFALISFILFCLSQPSHSQYNPHPPPVFKIDLDLPPQERFKEVVLAKNAEIQALVSLLLSEYPIPQFLFTAVGFYEEIVYQHHECYEELQGIAKYSNLSFGEVFLVNFIYEILAACTSIVSLDKHGNIIHGRNLDYPFQPYLANLTVHLEFYRNGELLFEGDGDAGFLGVVTGLKPNAFGISINERNKGGPLQTIYEIMFRRTFSIPFFIRRVLETAENFTSAVEMLSTEEFAAPAYLTVSGVNKNEGVVITRDRRGVYNISQIDFDSVDQWFLVQTNYDRDVPDPASDYRRVPAEKRMREIGKNAMDLEALYNHVMILEPNKRNETITSSVMCPRTGTFNTTVWY
jgi:hypothetical protein